MSTVIDARQARVLIGPCLACQGGDEEGLSCSEVSEKIDVPLRSVDILFLQYDYVRWFDRSV